MQNLPVVSALTGGDPQGDEGNFEKSGFHSMGGGGGGGGGDGTGGRDRGEASPPNSLASPP